MFLSKENYEKILFITTTKLHLWRAYMIRGKKLTSYKLDYELLDESILEDMRKQYRSGK